MVLTTCVQCIQCMHMKQIRISEETYKRLLQLKAEHMIVHNVSASFNDVISDTLDFLDENGEPVSL